MLTNTDVAEKEWSHSYRALVYHAQHVTYVCNQYYTVAAVIQFSLQLWTEGQTCT